MILTHARLLLSLGLALGLLTAPVSAAVVYTFDTDTAGGISRDSPPSGDPR